MVSMNISIKREAYTFLKALKTKEKSFSDVILSFKNNQQDIMCFFGLLKENNWNEKERHMKDFREVFNKRLQ